MNMYNGENFEHSQWSFAKIEGGVNEFHWVRRQSSSETGSGVKVNPIAGRKNPGTTVSR